MKTTLFFLFLALAIEVHAQTGLGDYVPQLSRVLGGSFQKFDGLNNRINAFPQYKQLPSYAAMIELGWFKERHRVISTGGIYAGSSLGANHSEKSSTIRYFGAHMDIGYELINSKNVTLYPLVGIGVSKYQARFFRDISGSDFTDILSSTTTQNSIHSLDLTNHFFTYRLGLGVAFKNPRYPSSSIAIQAGYEASFDSNPWRSNQEQSLVNAPEDRLSRVFVELVLTGSSHMMKH